MEKETEARLQGGGAGARGTVFLNTVVTPYFNVILEQKGRFKDFDAIGVFAPKLKTNPVIPCLNSFIKVMKKYFMLENR